MEFCLLLLTFALLIIPLVFVNLVGKDDDKK